ASGGLHSDASLPRVGCGLLGPGTGEWPLPGHFYEQPVVLVQRPPALLRLTSGDGGGGLRCLGGEVAARPVRAHGVLQ
ncbi:unnamed protein product, partial [Effrenium voratum]